MRVLPKRLRLSDWHLIYSTYNHGITLSTLYSKVQQEEDPGESILVIRDNSGNVCYNFCAGPQKGRKGRAHELGRWRLSGWRPQIFGCFATHPWRQEPFYYGAGEMFLFRLHPTWKVYHWSGKNSYFQLGHHNCLAVGGRCVVELAATLRCSRRLGP